MLMSWVADEKATNSAAATRAASWVSTSLMLIMINAPITPVWASSIQLLR